MNRHGWATDDVIKSYTTSSPVRRGLGANTVVLGERRRRPLRHEAIHVQYLGEHAYAANFSCILSEGQINRISASGDYLRSYTSYG